MKAGKYIIYAILTLLVYINIFNVYFSAGMNPFTFTRGYLMSVAMPFLTVFIMWLGMLLIFLSYLYPKVIVKKNLLRINLIILFVFIIISFISRIIELVNGKFFLFTWTLTLLYILLFVINILILKELYKFVNELFLEKNR